MSVAGLAYIINTGVQKRQIFSLQICLFQSTETDEQALHAFLLLFEEKLQLTDIASSLSLEAISL